MASLLDQIDSIARRWMLLAPRQHWGRLMGGLAALLDGMREGVYEGRLAAMPGQTRAPNIGGNPFESFDALALIGRDRSVRRGLSEDPYAYAARLRAWLDIWASAGTPYGLLLYVQALLAPNPGTLRIVTARGDWWTLETDGRFTWQRASLGWTYDPAAGTLTTPGGTAHAWSWDSLTLPPNPGQNDHARFWLICYAPCGSPFCDASDGTFQDFGVFADFWNDVTTSGANGQPDAGVIGLATPVKWVENLRNVVNEFRMAGAWCSHIIVSFDPAAFNPTSDSTPTSIPDSQWGWHSKWDSGTNEQIPARFPNARYIPAMPGGVAPP